MAGPGVYPKVNDDDIYPEDVNVLYHKTMEVYTGAGFDTSGGNDSNSYELTAVSSTDASAAIYAFLDVCSTRRLYPSSQFATVHLKIEIKETGDSYSTLFDEIIDRNQELNDDETSSGTVSVVATLTAGMKSNGFQVQITSYHDTMTGGVITHNNKFTVLKVTN